MLIDDLETHSIASRSKPTWDENNFMIKKKKKNGFEFQYRFLENYLYYKKIA